MRTVLPFGLALALMLAACRPATPQPIATLPLPPTATSQPSPTASPTPTETPSLVPTIAATTTPTPTPTGSSVGVEPEPEEPPPSTSLAFEFTFKYSGDATAIGQAHSCNGVRGPWSLAVAVQGSPEPGATIETSGEAVFTVPDGVQSVELRIPTSGTGTFDYDDGVGEGTVTDPLLFIFRLLPEGKQAEITLTSTGEGTVVLHLPDGVDVPIRFGTVFAADPTFTVSLVAYDGCP